MRARLALGVLLVALPLLAQAHDKHKSQAAPQQAPGAIRVEIADTPLLDQAGRSVRIRSEVFGDRVVVANFVYTTCTTVCPVSTAIMAQLQERLGARLGREVALVSISVDPARDTPQRLREYANQYGAREGWVWLTGRKGVLDGVNKAFGAYSPNPEDHPPLVMVGDARTQSWARFYGFPGADELLAQVDKLLAARANVR